MNLLGIANAVQYMITGAVLLAAVVIDSVSRRTQKSAGPRLTADPRPAPSAPGIFRGGRPGAAVAVRAPRRRVHPVTYIARPSAPVAAEH